MNIGIIQTEVQNIYIVFFLPNHIFEVAVDQQTVKNTVNLADILILGILR